jgi:hypothetical protein
MDCDLEEEGSRNAKEALPEMMWKDVLLRHEEVVVPGAVVLLMAVVSKAWIKRVLAPGSIIKV